MKKRWRKQRESMTQYMIKNLDGTEEIPFLFKDKMLKAGLLSFFIAVIGTYMGVQFEEASFFDTYLDIGSVFVLSDFQVSEDWENRRI